MTEKDINRWQETIVPRDLTKPWVMGPGGSFDMQKVKPIPDSMLTELAQRYNSHGCPWNCRSMPLSPGDREYMYLLYYSMQGLVARMRIAEKQAAVAPDLAMMVRRLCSRTPDGAPRITDKTRADALALLKKHGLLGNGLRETEATPQQEQPK